MTTAVMMTVSFSIICFVAPCIHLCGSAKLDSFCKYSKMDDVICTGRGLHYIPQFSKHVTFVTCYNTSLQTIGEKGFINLTYSLIWKLNFTDNLISFIHPFAFYNLTLLKSLSISNERNLKVDSLKFALRHMSKSTLQVLHFIDNGWTKLPIDMFENFAGNKIKRLEIKGNTIKYMNCSTFGPLTILSWLSLANNSLQHITLRGIPNVRTLYLNTNLLYKLPRFCSMTDISLLKNLKFLELSNSNVRDIGKHGFRCLSRVEVLKLDYIHIGRRIRDNVFSQLPSLHLLSLIAIGNPLKHIEDFAFNSSSLSKLILAESMFHFDLTVRYNPKTIFSLCPNLTVLDLTNSYLPTNGSILEKMCSSLSILEHLNLRATGLYFLPLKVFSKLKSLTKLGLNSNKITNLDDGAAVFNNLKSLKKLDLGGNRIQVIHQQSFPNDVLLSLTDLDLSQNPFLCTCDQLWFTEWIKQTTVNLVRYPHYYKCNNPVEMKGVGLKQYAFQDKSCPPWNPLYTMAIVLSLCVTVVGIAIIMAVKCQINIKNYLYLLRVTYNKRSGYIPLEDGDNFEYHAFVVYCSSDENWVHKVLLQKLEKEQDMKLCIHHREFEVGETITGNIDKFLQRCQKVVIILSNDFAKSEWCQWEVDVVHEKRRRQGKNVFVLIMLKNIDSKHMTSQLRILLNSAPYLRYQKGAGEDLFWKAVIKSLNCPIGNPPISVL